MFGLNPVASGILIGGIGGVFGSVTGGLVGAMKDKADGIVRDATKAQKQQQKVSAQNQNALVEDQYNKKKAARGMGESLANPAASGMSGSLLNTSGSGDGLVNLLG